MERQLFNELSKFRFTYVEDGDIWFVAEKYPFIFQICMEDWTVKNVITVKGKRWMNTELYWDLVKVENRIILLPINHNKIVIYHIDTNEFNYIALDKAASMCMWSYKEGEYLYLISRAEIVVLDILQEKISEYISIPYEGDIIIGKVFGREGHILIPLIYRNQIIDFCITDKSFSCLDIKYDTNGYIAGLFDGSDVWMAGCNGSIVKWNYVSGECVLYDELPEGFRSFNYEENRDFVPWKQGWAEGICLKYWYYCFIVGDKIWFIPLLSDSLLYIDRQSNIMCQYKFENEEETGLGEKNFRSVKFLFMGIYRNRYIKIYSVKREVIYSIDAEMLVHTEENFDFECVDEEKIGKIVYDTATCQGIYENEYISVKQLINAVNSNKLDYDTEQMCGETGTYIYQFLENKVNSSRNI